MKMAIERTYNVPLRKEFQKAPRYKRAKKAITALKQFLAKHMKTDEVKIGRNLNEFIWNQGIKNPPHHVKVTVIKDDDNVARAELFGYKYVEPTKEELEELAEKADKEETSEEQSESDGAQKLKGSDKKEEAPTKTDKVVEKVENKPSLAKEAAEKPEAVQEEIKAEKLTEELQKEESVPQERREEEKEIKETIEEIKKPAKADKVPTTHELAAAKKAKKEK